MPHSVVSRSAFLATLAGAGALCVHGFAHASTTDPNDAYWRKKLTPAQYYVLRESGTEAPFSSPLLKEHRAGIYSCAGCSLELFSSKTKYDSGEGWPSFWAPLPHAVQTKPDYELVEERTEVHCARCAGHLGHLFDDGPPPTGNRYCIDGVALTFTASRG